MDSFWNHLGTGCSWNYNLFRFWKQNAEIEFHNLCGYGLACFDSLHSVTQSPSAFEFFNDDLKLDFSKIYENIDLKETILNAIGCEVESIDLVKK